MSQQSHLKKAELLGMPFGTACGRLRKIVLFSLLQRHHENICFKCACPIESAEELSIEHKKPWQNADPRLFWDLSNIAFSHLRCNRREQEVWRKVVDGKLWCPKCAQMLGVAEFHKSSNSKSGYTDYCKSCGNAKRKVLRAKGNCTSCAAERGAKPFRTSHNLCLECHQQRVAACLKSR